MTGGNATVSKRSSALIALLALTLVACTALSLRALSQNSLAEALQQQSAFLPVRDAYQLDGALTPEGALRLYWQIAEDYYLYQHAFKVRSLSQEDAEPLFIHFPPALAKTDEFFGV